MVDERTFRLRLKKNEGLYRNGEKTAKEIAEQYGVHIRSVYDHMNLHDIEYGSAKKTSERDAPTKAIFYIVTTRGPISKWRKGIFKAPHVKTQYLTIRVYAKSNGLELITHFHAHSSAKGADFFTKPEFKKILEKANSENCVVLIHDAFRLLAKIPNDIALDHFLAFATGTVEIVDTLSLFSFRNSDPKAFTALFKQAKNQLRFKRAISSPSKIIGKPTDKRTPLYAKKNAEFRREELRADVTTVINDLNKTGNASLQKITDELNDRGIKPIRANKWSKATLANILKKLKIDHRK